MPGIENQVLAGAPEFIQSIEAYIGCAVDLKRVTDCHENQSDR